MDLSKTNNWLTVQNMFSVSDLPTTGTPYYLSIRYVGHHESTDKKKRDPAQRYTYRMLQTIQMKHILLFVRAEPAVLGSAGVF